MDSRIRNRAVLPAAVAAAALAGWFGTGLDPIWWTTWLLPAAGCLAAAQVRGRWAWLPGTVAMFAGELNLWSYVSFLPLPVRLLLLLIPAVAFGLCTGWFSRLARSGRIWLALVAPAAAWVTFEFVYSRLSPHGTFGVLAYSQMNCGPILQLGSLGGVWLIDGMLFVIGAALALLAVPLRARSDRTRVALAAAAVLGLAAGFGGLRLREPVGGPTVTVGLIASDRTENLWFREPPASEAILRRYLARVPALRAAGAEVVVLPEHLLALREAEPERNGPELERLLQAAAEANGVAIVIGVDRRDAAGTEWNEARLYRPGVAVVSYDKRHLLPGFENQYHPGSAPTVFDHGAHTLGLAICKDLDFPSLGRDYGQRSVAALIVPAFDFTADGWLHGRMAMMRGVESGFAVVRVAKRGRLTVSNHRGEVLADTRSDAAEFATLVTPCPLRATPTLYVRWGDWCGWLAVLVTAVGLIADLRTRRTKLV